MCQIMVVEQLHENSVVVNEGACTEGISEALNWHGVVVDADGSVDVELFSLDCFNISGFFSKDSESELTIVDVHEGILLACSVLLNLFASNVAVLITSNHLGEGVLVGLETVHHNMEFSIVLLDHGNGSGRVITDYTGNDWELGLNILRLCQVLKQLSIVVELKIWLELFVLLDILSFFLIF